MCYTKMLMTISLRLDDKHYPSNFPKYLASSTTDAILKKTLSELVSEASEGGTPYYIFAIATLRDSFELPCRYEFYDAYNFRNEAHPAFKKNLDPLTHAVIERVDYFAIPILLAPKQCVAIPYPPKSYYSTAISSQKVEKYAFDAANFHSRTSLRKEIQQNLYNYLCFLLMERPELEEDCLRWQKILINKI